MTLLLLKFFSNLVVHFTNSGMPENLNQFFEDTIAHTVEKICLVWLNLLKHIVSFAYSEKLGMYKKCIREYSL